MAWRGEDGPTDLFRPELIEDASVAFLAQLVDGVVVAGAALNRSSTVVGVSNVFARSASGSFEQAASSNANSSMQRMPDKPLRQRTVPFRSAAQRSAGLCQTSSEM